jgi:CRISPR/Cas system-associated exonuclease Cas4 (RecB family)
MVLPDDFQFSQSSLQDYVDCPRRFQLRYVRRLRWPAIEVEPALENERHLRRGAAFHRLVRQHLLGLPVETLSRAVTDAVLQRWWHNYLENGLAGLPSHRYPEVRLSMSVGDHRLVAKYDLVAVEPGQRALIVDWKTNRERPRRGWLAERLQTRVYPYVLVQAARELDGAPVVQSDRVAMVYWFANFPSAPERFRYAGDQHRADEEYLVNLIEEVEASIGACPDGALLPRTEDRERCRICRYRSLCQRGVEPGASDEGDWSEISEMFDVSLDLEQIAELDVV